MYLNGYCRNEKGAAGEGDGHMDIKSDDDDSGECSATNGQHETSPPVDHNDDDSTERTDKSDYLQMDLSEKPEYLAFIWFLFMFRYFYREMEEDTAKDETVAKIDDGNADKSAKDDVIE